MRRPHRRPCAFPRSPTGHPAARRGTSCAPRRRTGAARSPGRMAGTSSSLVPSGQSGASHPFSVAATAWWSEQRLHPPRVHTPLDALSCPSARRPCPSTTHRRQSRRTTRPIVRAARRTGAARSAGRDDAIGEETLCEARAFIRRALPRRARGRLARCGPSCEQDRTGAHWA